MILKKEWYSKKHNGGVFENPTYIYTGYLLFGLIPLFISRKIN